MAGTNGARAEDKSGERIDVGEAEGEADEGLKEYVRGQGKETVWRAGELTNDREEGKKKFVRQNECMQPPLPLSLTLSLSLCCTILDVRAAVMVG